MLPRVRRAVAVPSFDLVRRTSEVCRARLLAGGGKGCHSVRSSRRSSDLAAERCYSYSRHLCVLIASDTRDSYGADTNAIHSDRERAFHERELRYG